MAFRIPIGSDSGSISNRKNTGFTLIELLVVMAIIATLMTLVTPQYFKQTERAKEVVLQHNLRGLREAIDQYRQDTAVGPQTLEDLVNRRYLRELPLDPITGRRDTWLTQEEGIQKDGDNDDEGIRDVHSGAEGNSANGTAYANW